MRIAFFSDNFYPEISGISDSIITLGETLAARGHAIAYVGPKYSTKDYARAKRSKEPQELEQFAIKRIPSIRFPGGSPTGQGRIALPFGFSKKFIEEFKPDIIHVQSPYGLGIEALMTARKFHIPFVGTNHTPVEDFMSYSPIRGNAVVKAVCRYVSWYYNHCQYITTPSNDLLNTMRTQGLKIDGRAQPNPLELKDFNPAPADEKQELKTGFGFSGPVILYSGRLAPEKHVDVIIRSLVHVVSQRPDTKLVVTGHGSAELELRKLAKNLHLENNVVFAGFVEKPRLIQLYKATDIFVIMSTAETQSLSLMQAFASAVPACAANARAFKEYVPPECGFLIEPGDDTALASKLKYLLDNDSVRENMGKAGVHFVEQFSTHIVADAWEKIYSEAIHGKTT